ncbi:MAG: hypothetical protein ACE5Z5_10410 [Candidatus Bathyarchaeia archaeon]
MARGSRRTTVILDEEDREFLDDLIRGGKEAGVKAFLTKMIDIYRNWSIHDWKYPGECYVGVSRVAFFNQESTNILIEHVPEEKRYEVGRKIGEAYRISFLTSFGLDSGKRESWNEVLRRLRILGYGDFISRNRFLTIRNPFLNDAELLRGFLEELLGALFSLKTETPPIVLEIA